MVHVNVVEQMCQLICGVSSEDPPNIFITDGLDFLDKAGTDAAYVASV